MLAELLDSRAARRRTIREKLAEIELVQQRIDELAREIAEHERLADLAADAHHATCEKIQKRLKLVEGRILSAMAERREVHPGDQDERVDLLKQLAAANETLATETGLREKFAQALRDEKDRLGVGHVGQRDLYLAKLANEENGDPELLDAHFLAGQRLHWASTRRRSAEAMLSDLEHDIVLTQERAVREGKTINQHSQATAALRVRRLRLEIEAAIADEATAKAEFERTRGALIDE